ncbi:efflux RND transporter periplasmic adaptor subunit [Pseudidiomarina homiensis]|uniref:Efflux transporter periplasmic adaptor subunit n=1 Tax=Pseudidiomarina homiensis TaxID=364198 RepID=A0A432Y349_9GAMM|nr:HlyD family efflux transporter periplasmic adaptor subunit [Pseudidiomarina homiensis]RUO55399.1 efflux transporter periplasmic adaptor subunit [Pseudidiomarina homiensis]
MKKPLAKTLPWLLLALVVIALVYSLRPEPPQVVVTTVYEGPLAATVNDEGRTHLRNTYQVSAPIAGYLRRVVLEPGDLVQQGDTVFLVEPSPTPALDQRSREQAVQTLNAAEARLQAAIALQQNSESEAQLATNEQQRIQKLHDAGIASTVDMERAQTALFRAQSNLRSATAAVAVAQADVSNAKLVLEIAEGSRNSDKNRVLEVPAPISGTVLQRYRCCEGVVAAGETILELGDLQELEVQVDLLSSAAVKVRPGMPARINQWGGQEVLSGIVRRVNPAGFTRISALGIEEQRVSVFIEFTEPTPELGNDYRVNADIVVEQAAQTLAVPITALFRQDQQWQVFVYHDGQIEQRALKVGFQSGIYRQILQGLEPGMRVVNHPSSDLENGMNVQL